MNALDFLQIFLAVIPSVIVGLVAYFFFKSYMESEEKKREHKLKIKNQKDILPQRIQAMERMTLFLERIDPGSLLLRIKPVNDDKNNYQNLLINNIENEFEHNLTQQIYLSDECWSAIRATKNATITLIRKNTANKEVDSADKLRELILQELVGRSAPSATGLAYIKKEMRDIW